MTKRKTIQMMMINENDVDPHLGGLILKMKFLRVMLPSMTLADANLFAEIYIRLEEGSITEQDVRNISVLYSKFEKRENVTLPKIG